MQNILHRMIMLREEEGSGYDYNAATVATVAAPHILAILPLPVVWIVKEVGRQIIMMSSCQSQRKNSSLYQQETRFIPRKRWIQRGAQSNGSPPVSAAFVTHAIVKAWWEFNGRPVFFNHFMTAKLVRRALKAEEGGEDGDAETTLE